jgi:pimeloyl-ACP methyl ester carboxylesterase
VPTITADDGTELAYHVHGDGEPLLCVPGGPLRAAEYLGDLGGLSAHRRLILLDLRGTGDSAVPADWKAYGWQTLVEDIETLRASLGLETADILAHSAAGDLGISYAARYPRRVRSLVLVTPSPRALGIPATLEQRLAAAALRAGEPWHAAAERALRSIFAGTETDDDWAAFQPLNYGRWDDAARAHAAAGVRQRNQDAAEAYFESTATLDPDATRTAVAELAAPVLVLAGELDGGPRPEVAEQVAAAFPDARVAVQPGAGHFPWLDDPGFFTGTVEGFLSRQPTGS